MCGGGRRSDSPDPAFRKIVLPAIKRTGAPKQIAAPNVVRVGGDGSRAVVAGENDQGVVDNAEPAERVRWQVQVAAEGQCQHRFFFLTAVPRPTKKAHHPLSEHGARKVAMEQVPPHRACTTIQPQGR